MIEFLINMTRIEQTLWGLLLVLFIYQFYFYIRYMAAPLRLNRKQESLLKNKQQPNSQPPVSVVICARNEAENLQQFLPSILEQDYSLFEVIVVNDGSEDDTSSVLALFASQYSHLHLTFVPCGAQVRSSKKLALTLGIKAAQYDYILLTDADCYPTSPQWICNMMAGFSNPNTEIVLGYGAYAKAKTLVNRFIQYDTLFNGLQYMGMAIAHRPYMGVGRNLAYKKSTFFEHKGFAGLLSSRAGDDDLLINKIANRYNTSVVLTQDSITWSLPKPTYREWLMQKERHLGVSPLYKTSTKIRLFIEPLTRGLFYATLLTLSVFVSTNWLMLTILGGILFVRWFTQCITLNVAAYRLQGQWFGLSILFFDIFLPLNNLYLFARHTIRKKILRIDIW